MQRVSDRATQCILLTQTAILAVLVGCAFATANLVVANLERMANDAHKAARQIEELREGLSPWVPTK